MSKEGEPYKFKSKESERDYRRISELVWGGVPSDVEWAVNTSVYSDQIIKEEKAIRKALVEQKFWNPYNVFNHPPEFYLSEDDRYLRKIHIVKWDTRSTRMTVLYARFNDKKSKWIFSRKPGLKRTPHGEKMR